MIQSVSDKLYNFMLNKLNNNTKDIHFAGNYGFRFHQPVGGIQTFSFLRFKADQVDPKESEFVPFVDRSSVEIPFNENNKRSDMEVEYWFAFKIEEKKDMFNNKILDLDTTTDSYQVMMETYKDLKDQLSYIDGDIKMSFKAREPQPVDVFKADGDYYKIVSLSLSLTKIEKGVWGHEVKLYFGTSPDVPKNDDHLLDVSEWSSIVGKGTKNTREINAQLRTHDVVDTGWEMSATINYNEKVIDDIIYNESLANVDKNNMIYYIKIVRENHFEIERPIMLFNLNATHTLNTPITISFDVKLAEE